MGEREPRVVQSRLELMDLIAPLPRRPHSDYLLLLPVSRKQESGDFEHHHEVRAQQATDGDALPQKVSGYISDADRSILSVVS
jgi:hypothetical protein